MPDSDSHLSTHSTPGAQLILSLLSFSPLGINVLKYLFIWMFVTLFWPSSSSVLHWVSSSKVSDFMPAGKLVCLERESALPITERKLTELPSSVQASSSEGNRFSSSDGRKYCYTGWALLSNVLLNLSATMWGKIWVKGTRWRNKACLSLMQGSVCSSGRRCLLYITPVV